ncbi:MAG: hypothetical protein HFJ45_03360 [Clostridia bacterium]|nr:hypothetical protein [Clostridia bacterium]
MLVKTLDNIENGKIQRIPQEGKVTIAPKIEKELSKINWDEKDAYQIKNLVRGLTPGLRNLYNIK